MNAGFAQLINFLSGNNKKTLKIRGLKKVESAGRLSNQLKEFFNCICAVKQLADKLSEFNSHYFGHIEPGY
jgi:hypothetical protein